MAHTLPALRELRPLIAGLNNNYTGTNLQRKSFLTLLPMLDSPAWGDDHVRDAIIGALIFELETIYNTYNLLSPTRSRLFQQIKQILKIHHDSPLSDDERLVYLNAFYRHVNMNVTDNTVAAMKDRQDGFIWANKDALAVDIKNVIKRVRKRDKTRIDQVVHESPGIDALKQGVANLSDAYQRRISEQTPSFWGRAERRDQLVNFINFVDLSCKHAYEQESIEHLSPPMRRAIYKKQTSIRKGLILFALLEIQSSYRFLSPKGGWFTSGSDLFKEALKVLNVKSLKDISAADKAEYLGALLTHLKESRNDQAEWNAFLATLTDETPILRTDKELYLEKIKQCKKTQDESKYVPSGRAGMATTAATAAASTTASYAIHSGVTSIAVRGAAGAAAATVGGLPGVAVYAAGMVVFDGLARRVGQNLITTAAAGVYTWLLDRVGRTLGSAAVDSMFPYIFDDSHDGIHVLRMKLKPEDDNLFCRWINTLLDLPPDVVSEEEKSGLRAVFGLEVGDTLAPLPRQERAIGMSAGLRR